MKDNKRNQQVINNHKIYDDLASDNFTSQKPYKNGGYDENQLNIERKENKENCEIPYLNEKEKRGEDVNREDDKKDTPECDGVLLVEEEDVRSADDVSENTNEKSGGIW